MKEKKRKKKRETYTSEGDFFVSLGRGGAESVVVGFLFRGHYMCICIHPRLPPPLVTEGSRRVQ